MPGGFFSLPLLVVYSHWRKLIGSWTLLNSYGWTADRLTTGLFWDPQSSWSGHNRLRSSPLCPASMASANRAPIEVQPAQGGEELPSCTGHSALWIIVVYFPWGRRQWETLQQQGGHGSRPLLSFRNLERTSCPFLLWSHWPQSLFQLSRKKNLLSAHFPRSRGIDTVTVLCLAGGNSLHLAFGPENCKFKGFAT